MKHLQSLVVHSGQNNRVMRKTVVLGKREEYLLKYCSLLWERFLMHKLPKLFRFDKHLAFPCRMSRFYTLVRAEWQIVRGNAPFLSEVHSHVLSRIAVCHVVNQMHVIHFAVSETSLVTPKASTA